MQRNSQIERHIGQGLEESQAQKLQSPWSWAVPPSWHMAVFTNPEAQWMPSFRGFYGSSIMEAWLIKSLSVGD